jgi:8-oxo-dGDP phosphatase
VVRVHDYRVLKSEHLYHGWAFELVADEVAMPGGATARREYFQHIGAVVAVPVDDAGRVALIRLYRHPARETLWELPAGIRDADGEDPADTARRELAEETDLRADRLDALGAFYTSPGVSSELIHYFLATGLSEIPEDERHARSEEETEIEVAWWDLDKAVSAVAQGEIRNGVCALGLQLAWARLGSSK